MIDASTIYEKLAEGGKAEVVADGKKVSIIGAVITDGILSIDSIVVEHDYSGVEDFRPISDEIASSLNKPSNPLGKGWAVLEVGPGKSYLVSSMFEERENSYKAYEVKVDYHGVRFRQHNFRKRGHPWKVNGVAAVLPGQLEDLVKVLLEVPDA